MKNDINLLYKRKIKTYSNKKIATTLLLIALFAVALYAGIAVPSNARNVLKIEAAQLDSKLNSSTETQQDLTEKTQQKTKLDIQLTELKAIDESRSDVSTYVEAIEKSVPTDVKLTQLALSDEMVSIIGSAKSDMEIATFCLRLREQNVFKDVYLMSSTSPADEPGSIFTVTATLTAPLSSIELIQAIEQIGTAVPATAASGTESQPAASTPAPEVISQ